MARRRDPEERDDRRPTRSTLLDAHLSATSASCWRDASAGTRRAGAASPHAGDEGRLNRELVGALAAARPARPLSARRRRRRPTSRRLELCLIREGLARDSTAAETAFALQGLGSFPILQSGAPAMVDDWVPRLARARRSPASRSPSPTPAPTSPRSSLAAERDGDGYRLTGEKIWISNAPDADVYSVFARTTPGAGARGLTAFAVPRESDGPHGERASLLVAAPDRTAALRRRPRARGERPRRGRPRDSGSRCAPSTCSGPASAPSRSAWRRRRSTRRSLTRAERQAFGGPLRRSRRSRTSSPTSPTRVQARALLVHTPPRAYDAGIRPITAGRGDGEAVRDRGRPGSGRRGDPGPRRAGARARPPAGAPLPRGARRRASTRAPPRSSARSSPAGKWEYMRAAILTGLAKEKISRLKDRRIDRLVAIQGEDGFETVLNGLLEGTYWRDNIIHPAYEERISKLSKWRAERSCSLIHSCGF